MVLPLAFKPRKIATGQKVVGRRNRRDCLILWGASYLLIMLKWSRALRIRLLTLQAFDWATDQEVGG
jgi:hypothetical protein